MIKLVNCFNIDHSYVDQDITIIATGELGGHQS